MAPIGRSPLAEFGARIHRSKNRQVSIPAAVQESIGLERRPDNHLIRVAIRRRGRGRWHQHYLKLTRDNEFSVPADVERLRPGDDVDVRILGVVPDVPATRRAVPGASALLVLARRTRPGWRRDGARRLDEYLRESG